tara:strand:+ start:13541 stop:14215 length:675 start_codon:yes stop_codon:yes gene_type:complete
MLQQKSKKIFIYFFLFLIVGTLNNKNFNNLTFGKVTKVDVIGLNENDNMKLEERFKFLRVNNLFNLDRIKLEKIVFSNNQIEEFSAFKVYPSSINIEIFQTEYLAYTKIENKILILGSNGKFIETKEMNLEIPYIDGSFDNQSFFDLKEAINNTEFSFSEIKRLFYFKSGRWDIKTKNGLVIRLPKENIEKSFELLLDTLNYTDKQKIKLIDLRQYNQVIVNEK